MNAEKFLSSLSNNLSNCAEILAHASNETLYELFKPGSVNNLPTWPAEDIQKAYTGGTGVSLVNRAIRFISILSDDGAFADQEWRGLDYGCGWGRIAACLLTRGTPGQLDLCDAWDKSIAFIEDGNYRNKRWRTSETLNENDLPKKIYDFVYAFSVFTHLEPNAMISNTRIIVDSLKEGGSLYFTVRGDDFIIDISSRRPVSNPAKLNEIGWWHEPYPNQTIYGETAYSKEFIDSAVGAFGNVTYMGVCEPFQHLYKCTSRMADLKL